MLKKLLFLLLCTAAMSFACQPYAADDPNANANNGSSTTNIAIDPKNMPPGFGDTNVAIDPKNMPPGFGNANMSIDPKNLPPGINPNAGKTPQPKNTPKIPGIPSEEEIKKQMKESSNMKAPPPLSESEANEKQQQSPTDRQRTVKKP